MIVYIRNGAVIAKSKLIDPEVRAGYVDIPDGAAVNIGDSYVNGVFKAPPAVQPQGTYPTLTPMQFYLKFTVAERIAVKASIDPLVKEFWETYQVALQTGSNIDFNIADNRAALAYMSANPVGTPILGAGRMDTILTSNV